MAFQLHDFEQVSLSAEALDAEGNAASYASVAWSSSDDTIAAVSGTGLDAVVTASPGAAGLGTATIKVDVTDTDGDVHTGTFDIEVIAGDAVAVNIVPGTPEPKPVEEPPVEEPPVEEPPAEPPVA